MIGDCFNEKTDYAGYSSYCGALMVGDKDAARTKAMVDWLTCQLWCGMIFTPGGDGVRGGVPGTFDHAAVLIDHPRAPDIYFIMRNDQAIYGAGVVGSCYYNGSYPQGGGTHGGLHPKELQMVMAADGSLFRSGWESSYPSGIIDIAPTILHLLGLNKPERADGRILHESLAGIRIEAPEPRSELHRVRHAGGMQHLKVSHVGTTTYLDKGWVE